EPPKAQLLAYDKDPSARAPPRLAFCILQFAGLAGVVETVCTLEAGREPSKAVVSWDKIHGVHALASPDDCFEAEAIAKADAAVQKLLKERYGVTDLDLVCCDPWSIHASPVDVRAIQCFLYLKTWVGIALALLWTLDTRSFTGNALIDRWGQVGVYSAVAVADSRCGLMVRGHVARRMVHGHPLDPLDTAEIRLAAAICRAYAASEGVEGEIRFNVISLQARRRGWHNWSFRLGFNYREGVVLHDVRYASRAVMHRMSLVEMAVPYADPREPYVRKCAFDVGDYGLGYCTFPLTLGCDCLGHIHYFDATLSNSKGEPVTLPKAICMHEEDTGLLYKHVDFRTGHPESRRGRRLVVSHIATVVNYEYAFYCAPCGRLRCTTRALLDPVDPCEHTHTRNLPPPHTHTGEDALAPDHGTLVGPDVNAQHHQHMFMARLDPAVDDEEGGRGLVVKELDVETMPWDGLGNPYGNGFRTVETALTSVHQAQRCIAPEKGRVWKFVNPKVINPVTHTPVAYKLVPAAHPPLLALPGSIICKKGHFATRQLWVTPHNDRQSWPAGDYVFGAKDCTGLAMWTREDAPLEGADPVVWYSFGVTHIVRPEDFPIMPVEVCGFVVKPAGFFTRNPCLDLPADKNAASVDNHSGGANGGACCGSAANS
ncbi:Copper amine oxidase 1, partial [Tetrabaena socialis]